MGFWLAVACAEHVRKGRAEGFMQVCHGKLAPLRQIKPFDGVAYYSPSLVMGEKDGFQTFTAIGTVKTHDLYQTAMSPGFMPYRRDVEWEGQREIPLNEVKGRLQFTQKPNWGYGLRFGLIEISEADFATLAEAMICDMFETERLTDL